MSQVIVGAAVLNQTPLDWEGNYLRIKSAISEAEAEGVKVLCLPEMCLTGYGCEDQFLAPFTETKAIEYLHKLASETTSMFIWVGLPMRHEGHLFNVAAGITAGKVVALIPKQHLADDGVHYEPRWFTPWPTGKRSQWQGIPFGDYRVRLGSWTMGVEICQDAWEGDKRPAHALAKRGVSIIVNPTASHFSFGKSQIRQALTCEGSRIIDGVYVFANLLGNESGRVIFDGDAYVAERGNIISQSNRFSMNDHELIYASVELKSVNDAGDDVISLPAMEEVSGGTQTFVAANWESSEYIKEEEFARSVSLGLWDYVRKSHAYGFVISLSGGADSSAIASLCYLASQLAENQLGWEGMKKRLAYIPWMDSTPNVKDFVKRFIRTLYQGTVNSSAETRASARTLADCIGSDHSEIQIDGLVAEYRQLIEGAIGRELSWKTDDITLQNVQARVRAPSAWMLANINNALLLATSNRSEASVGYATMDGDTSGSISPIAGIDKSFIRIWLKWMQETGLAGTWKVSGLSGVNALEPSAELRPLDSKQVDEEDLMPYPILNALERWSFYERLSPEECVSKLNQVYGAQFDATKLDEFAHRFFRLWARNQWKRERYAPGFHVDDYSLDPKSWLRFPILSAGLEKDLPACI
jgi:NAD+ synthase (glutamine-hydrolysing)